MTAADASATPRTPTTPMGRAAVLFTVTLANTLYATTILVVSVILPQMQGSLSATQDQIAWAMTFNILATAIVTPMTGWLTSRFGRRNVMIWSQFGFTVSTLLCGLATSLEALVLFRILQGAFGAPIVPLGQATVLDTYPKSQHGFATSVFGMGVVVGPVIGPIIGGELAELYNWRWAFFMIVPVALAGLVGLWLILPDKPGSPDMRFEWTGFLTLSAAVVCLQLMLDRGERQDWFDSYEIILYAGTALLAFYIFVAHSLTHPKPFLSPRLLLNRNYSIGLVTVTVYGMLNFTPMVLFPPMLQQIFGFPNSVIGELLAARGAGAIIGFFLAMYIAKLDPRVGMMIAVVIQAASGFHMMTFDMEVTFEEVAIAGFMQGIAIGIFWVPLTMVTFSTVPPANLPETSAIFHLLRNIGSSIFISLSVTALLRTGRISYAEMTEHVTPYNPALHGIESLGIWGIGSAPQLAALSEEIARQAAMIGYLNAFLMYTIATLCWVPLVLAFKPRKAGVL